MNTISLILASMLCAGTPAIVETPESKTTVQVVQTNANNFKLGKTLFNPFAPIIPQGIIMNF